jgi:isoamylase
MSTLGGAFDQAADSVRFGLFSRNATRIDLYLYDDPLGAEERLTCSLEKEAGSIWSVTIPLEKARNNGIASTIYYGYRVWGPNWPYHASWQKGSAAGFITDVDNEGNRFNPNKLLLDPYAREISHDPQPRLSFIDPNEYLDDYYTGDSFRDRDTGKIAPKGIVFLDRDATSIGDKPKRLLKDDVIYEAHLRGLTMLDPSIPAAFRGTYQGAALKAPYLKDLGVTAVEFLPIHAFANEQNDDGDPRGDNYWGYMTLNYFSPNRRYSSDKSPGGPTREFRAMVRAFHDLGIKVFLDVAYNHSAEGLLKRMSDGDDSRQDDARQFPDRACLLSFRGLDNASYYQLRSNPALDAGRTCQRYQDNSACGANLKVKEEVVRNLVLDSLKYWSQEMGVDGFRFDLAPVLGNDELNGCYRFVAGDPTNILNRAVRELPARSVETLKGVDLIAEPWTIGGGEGGYQLGNFPDGWSEWNNVYQNTFRSAENEPGVEELTPGKIANAFSGSEQQFRCKTNPAPCHSINFLVAHDGFTLRDLFSYTGGNISWDHFGERSLQRKAVRNALAILMVSAGVPMITAGDEFFRSLSGRINTVAEDNDSVYLDWQSISSETGAGDAGNGTLSDEALIYRFAAHVIGFRNLHIALRPAHYFTGARSEETGLPDIAWYSAEASEVSGRDWDDPAKHFLGFRIDGKRVGDPASSIYIGYNRDAAGVDFNLPGNLPGERWYRVCDTSESMEAGGNWESPGTPIDGHYHLHDRSLAIFIEKPRPD